MNDTLKKIGLLGFGEAGKAFARGWRQHSPDLFISAFDIKTDGPDANIKRDDYLRFHVNGCDSIDGLSGASIFSLVTADKAYSAAKAAALHMKNNAFFFDGNSCAPQTKQHSAELIEAQGGRYADVAIMSPVHPKLHNSPLLISGPHASEAAHFLKQLGMDVNIVPGDIGAASSVKMVRSIMMKGLEAVMIECVLAGRAAGVDDRVLTSLDVTYPAFNWQEQAARMMKRATTHGARRAAEMREVAKTVEMLGLPFNMSSATVSWMEAAASSNLGGFDPALNYADMSNRLLKSVRSSVSPKNSKGEAS